jgi:hypothetical protein
MTCYLYQVFTTSSVFRQEPDQPRLDVNGNARGCLNTFGRFWVKQVRFDAGGTLIAFWATFEQACVGAAASTST